jgi:probable selenate reductase FAD-binding subunit
MLNIDKFISPSDLTEAYQILQSCQDAVLLGGCGYLRLADRKIGTAIDLASLGLDYIHESDDYISIGAMTSLRTIETDPLSRSLGAGVLTAAVKDIVGVQLRQAVTIGGSVAGRYPFSDPVAALLALDAQLVFHANGTIRFEDYLAGKPLRDILIEIIVPKNHCLAAFCSFRKAKTDYSVLNVAVAKSDDNFKIVVGSRPSRAIRVNVAEEYLEKHGLNNQTLLEASSLVAETLTFGTNPRGSSEYRKAICPVLVQRALTEVMHAV